MQSKEDREMIPRTKLWLIAGLMIIATILFVIGLAIERSGGHQEVGAAHTEEVGEVHSDEANNAHVETSGETHSEEGEQAHAEESGEAPIEERGQAHSEAIFGLNLESPLLVGAAVLVSLVLAGALLYFGHPVLMVIIPVTVILMLLDVVEVIRQVDAANTGIAAIAAVIVLLRLVIILLAILALRERRMSLPQAGSPQSTI